MESTVRRVDLDIFNKKLRKEIRTLSDEVESLRSQINGFQAQMNGFEAQMNGFQAQMLPAVEQMGNVDAARNEAALARQVQLLREADLDDLRLKYAELLESYELIAGTRDDNDTPNGGDSKA